MEEREQPEEWVCGDNDMLPMQVHPQLTEGQLEGED